jgi:DNA end-binding protein Ku
MATRTKRARQWRLPKKTARKKAAKKKSTTGTRAMWKGVVTFGGISVPVKLYSAVTDKSIHFRLLDPREHQPVKFQMVDPKTDETVEHEESKKAWQSKAGLLVLLDAAELEKTEPKPSRDIDVQRFVDPDVVEPAWYERPYWLGPDTNGNAAYFAVARALAEQKKVGIVRWVMRGKDYVGALKAEGDYLALITLRHKGEVVSVTDLPKPSGRDLNKSEVDMATQLVESMRGDWDPKEFKDEYRERVLELVEAKAKGKVLKFPKAPAKRESTDLASALQKSLAASKKRKTA